MPYIDGDFRERKLKGIHDDNKIWHPKAKDKLLREYIF